MRTDRFRRSDRLLHSRDYHRVARGGSRAASNNFVVLVAPRSLPRDEVASGRHRLGVTVSRRVGNAVVRNRVKRRIREWFRQHRGELAGELELVVIARRGAAQLGSHESAADLAGLLKRAGKRHRGTDRDARP